MSPCSNFDFHKYIKWSLEDDFKVVVCIRFPYLTLKSLCIISLVRNFSLNMSICQSVHCGSLPSSVYFLTSMAITFNCMYITNSSWLWSRILYVPLHCISFFCPTHGEITVQELFPFLLLLGSKSAWYDAMVLQVFGLKLELVIMEMAQEIQNRTTKQQRTSGSTGFSGLFSWYIWLCLR